MDPKSLPKPLYWMYERVISTGPKVEPLKAPNDQQIENSRPWVIIGLGNPGSEYENSRHNAGIMCLRSIARSHGLKLSDRRKHAIFGEERIASKRVILAIPRVYMNTSGMAVKYLRDRFAFDLDRLLVIVDDMDLPVGKLRLRSEGGSGGHNGLNSINDYLGSDKYARLRIGIGRPMADSIRHVLGPFGKSDYDELAKVFEKAEKAVSSCIESGIQVAMNIHN
jgi:PTH1 family peptidyl-tRNA hydrolase